MEQGKTIDEVVIEEKKLLKSWLQKRNYLSASEIELLFTSGVQYFANTAYLYRLYRGLVKNMSCVSEEGEAFALHQAEDEDWILSVNQTDIPLRYGEVKELLSGMIDVLERVFPLGTVVELKKEYLAKMLPPDKPVKHVRIVITHRFLNYTDGSYFPYAGVVYPTGMLGHKERLHFSSALIDKVLREGFSDIEEDAYIYMMKREFLVDKGMCSVGFAGKVEQEQVAHIIKEASK